MKHSQMQRYGFAVLVTALTLLFKLLLDPLIGRDTPFLLFLSAVFLSTWYGGTGSGLLATALATCGSNFYFLYPFYSSTIESPQIIVHLGVFMLEGVLISLLLGRLQSAWQQADSRVMELQKEQETLHQSKAQFKRLFESNIIGVIISTLDGKIVEANEEFLQTVGYTRKDLLAQKVQWPAMTPPEYQHLDERALEELRTTGVCTPFEKEYMRSDGNRVPVVLAGALLEGSTDTTIGFVLDLTKQKQAEDVIRRQKDLLKNVIDNNPTLIFVKDRQGKFQLANQAVAELLQAQVEDIIGKTAADFCPEPADVEQFLRDDQEVLATGQEKLVEESITNKAGEVRWFQTLKRPLLWENGHPYVLGLSMEITARKRMEEQLRNHAFHDPLTELPNRTLFMDRLEQAIQQAKQHEENLFAVIFLDLDRFKVVNDSLGHLMGDQLLIAIASRLKGCLRSIDTAARLGGDEFTILLEGLKDISDAIQVAERIQQELALPVEIDRQEVFTTASIGITLSSNGYDRPEDVLRDADTAMYRAKALGKARYEIFNTDMYETAVYRLQLETALRRALDRQEFQVYYQPLVSLTTGRISGFEALLRWQHPDRGLVFPASFIPVAEETGLIVSIGYWVLHEACRQMQDWLVRFRDHSLNTISVNLSGKQFSQPDLIEQIRQILQETGLNAGSLELEITESVIMDNGTETMVALSQLRGLGIQLTIDDFGTGYSSLGRLHSFPINLLKIDRSFVSPVDMETGNFEMIETIVTLAHKLGYKVVAEGVETASQLALLRKLNCEYGQGYLFSPPLASSVVEALILASPHW